MRDIIKDDGDGEEKKPAPDGVRTHDLFVLRHVLYRSATNATPIDK